MDKINDGGHAFPNNNGMGSYTYGMSLRDWYAGKALSELIARQPNSFCENRIAISAYLIADAMLKARE